MKAFILSFLLILSLTGHSSAFLEKLFGGNQRSNNQCPLKLYNPNDPSFTGHKIYANVETFHPLLETLSTYAKQCHVKIDVKQSFIQEDPAVSPIMLRDLGAMKFRLGEAIEFDLVDRNNRVICGRKCLKKSLSRLSGMSDAKCFLRKVADNGNFEHDNQHPTILMKRSKSNEPLLTLHDKRKELQKKCKKFQMNQ